MSNNDVTFKAVKMPGHKRGAPAQGHGADPIPKAADYSDLYRPQPIRPHTLLFFALVAAALFAGWRMKGEEFLIAESGPGYALGIIGGAMMLLLLLYPLRKKARFMRNWGQTKHWFRTHMILGVIGPALIVFHSNFSIGSINSTVVLFTMLLVTGSGLVGRYIYTKIHYGLYGRQLTLKELQEDLTHKKSSIVFVLKFAPKLKEKLLAFDNSALKTRDSFLSSLWGHIAMSTKGRWTHLALLLELRRSISAAAKRHDWSTLDRRRRRKAIKKHISIHMKAARRISEFNVYERFMSLWHLFHFPLFIMLVIAGVAHILAVHMY